MEQIPTEADKNEYLCAFKSVRRAFHLFGAIVLLAIIIQLVGFVLIDFVGICDSQASTTTPATMPASCESCEPCATAFSWLLPATKCASLIACLLMLLTVMLAVNLSLLGRLGGLSGFMCAFFGSLILLAVLVPWQHVLGQSFVRGAMFNLDELCGVREKVDGSWLRGACYYAGYLVYPILAAGLTIVIQIKFAAGYKKMTAPQTVADQQDFTEPTEPAEPSQDQC